MHSVEEEPSPAYCLPPPEATIYRWTVVGMLWFICFFNYADRLAIFSVFPVLEKQYHFSKEELGAIGAAFTWVYAVGSPLAGHVGDRYPRKWVILGGLYIWSLITGLTAQCTQFWQFMMVRGSEGLGEAFYMPASMALISDYHGPATRSRAIGLHQTSIYAGTIGGGALAGWMALHWGWQSPFWMLALIGIALGAVLQLFLREPRQGKAIVQSEAKLLERSSDSIAVATERDSMRAFLGEFFRSPTAVLLVVAFFGANLVGFVFLTWMPTFLKEKFGLNLALAGLGATVFIQVASMVGALLGGVVADYRARTLLAGRIQVQALAILCAAPFVFLCGYTRNPWWLMVAMTLFGLFKGIYDASLTASFYDVIRPARRSTATGLMNFIGWMGAGLGSFVIGYAVDHHVTMSAAISSTAVIYLIVAVLLAIAAITRSKEEAISVQINAS